MISAHDEIPTVDGTDGRRQVSSVAELRAAVTDATIRHITITEDLAGAPTLRLSPGQTLTGAGQPTIRFAEGQDGLQLSADNEVNGLHLIADPGRRAIFNDSTMERLGRLVLRDLRVSGVVRVLAREAIRGGHIESHDIHIVAADARAYDERPKGYGVEVVPGAFTIWNQQPDPAVRITADLTGLSAGHPGAPVRGSGPSLHWMRP